MTNHRPLLEKAIKIAGSQARLAEAIGLSQQGVSYLLNGAPTISAEISIAIDRLTNGEVSKEELRPDIFGPAPVKTEAA